MVPDSRTVERSTGWQGSRAADRSGALGEGRVLVDRGARGASRALEDDAAFERFFAAEQAGAQRLAARLGPPGAAEDVTAEAFTRLYRHWDAVEDPLRYLRRAVRSLVVDELRRSDVARRHLHRVVDGETAPGRPVEEAVADVEQVSAALRRLAPRQREAVVLRYGLDLSEADVARRMGVSAGTVKSSTSRALASLRELVA